MTTHRRKLLPCCIAAALLSGQALAVGLGDIALKSYLGKPLQAEVALNDMGELSADQIKIKIGSEADYQALGVEYNYLHSQLKIEPFLRNGHGYVRITTREPISEPYLNFVLNLHWPQGQVAREFTVLLDPTPTAIATAAQSDSLETTAAQNAPAPAATLAPRRHRSETAVLQDGAYVVQRGDSLWRIAERLRPANVSLQQAMNAIVERNPHAFINGDPARLKEAASIVAPTAEQIAAASGAAVAPVADRGAATSAAPHDDLSEENAVLKAQVASLNDNVTSLNQNLAQSEQRLHQLEGQLDGILQQLQQQRATMTALSNNGNSPQAVAVNTSTGSMINQVNAAELKPTPLARTPWWVHLLYWLGIGGAATWAIREHFWPQRRLALLAAADTQEFATARTGNSNLLQPSWRAPIAHDRQRSEVETLVNVLDEEAAASAGAGEPAPLLLQPNDDPVDVSISAGVFLAFGRYDEAERLLRDALKIAPERVDLKLQLLDVCLQADKREDFEELASEIEQGPTTPEIIAELAVLRESYRSRRH